MLGTLFYHIIRKVQQIIHAVGQQPFQSLREALIKLFCTSDYDRFHQLSNRTELGNCKPSELLSEMCTHLKALGSQNADLNKLLEKSFLDKLQAQVHTISVASP